MIASLHGGCVRRAGNIASALGLLPLLALAACSADMAPAAPPPAASTVVVTIASVADSVTAGDPLQFRVSAKPAPQAKLTVTVTIAACNLAQTTASVTIAAGKSQATLPVPTTGVAPGAEGCEVTATIAAGDGYEVGAAAYASASATVRLPEVTIEADSESVEEGSPVSFTLTASPPPAADLTVNVSWSGGDSYLTETRPATVTIPVSGTFALTAATDDDSVDEPNDSVKVTIGAGNGYTVGSSDSATVEVTDNDATTASPGPSTPGPSTPAPSGPLSAVSIATAASTTLNEGDSISFTVTATPAPTSTLTVSISYIDNGKRLESRPPSVEITTSGTATLQVTVAVGRPTTYNTVVVGIDGGPDTYTLGDQTNVTLTIE